MNRKEEYNKKCFSPDWLEVDLGAAENNRTKKESEGLSEQSDYSIKEERLESRRRKDLNTLLNELEQIKQTIERTAEKQHRLANLMRFYTGEFAK